MARLKARQRIDRRAGDRKDRPACESKAPVGADLEPAPVEPPRGACAVETSGARASQAALLQHPSRARGKASPDVFGVPLQEPERRCGAGPQPIAGEIGERSEERRVGKEWRSR